MEVKITDFFKAETEEQKAQQNKSFGQHGPAIKSSYKRAMGRPQKRTLEESHWNW